MKRIGSLPTIKRGARGLSIGTPDGSNGSAAVSISGLGKPSLTLAPVADLGGGLQAMLPVSTNTLIARMHVAARAVEFNDPLKVPLNELRQARHELRLAHAALTQALAPASPVAMVTCLQMLCDLTTAPMPHATALEVYEIGLADIPATLLREATHRLIKSWSYVKLPLPGDFAKAVAPELKDLTGIIANIAYLVRRIERTLTHLTGNHAGRPPAGDTPL